MRYRVSANPSSKYVVDIRDVVECDEKLCDGKRVRYGIKLDKSIKISTLFWKLRFAFLTCNKIARFEEKDGKYYIDWVQGKGDAMILHQDVLEVDEDVPEDFKYKMSILLKKYKWNALSSRYRIMAKIEKQKPNDQMVKKCVDFLCSNDSNESIGDVKTITELYKYICDNQHLFRCIPKKLSPIFELFYRVMNTAFSVIFSLGMVLVVVLLILGSYFVGAMLAGFAFWMYSLVRGAMDEVKQAVQQDEFATFMEKLVRQVDCEYFKKLSEAKEAPGLSFTDFVERDIEYIKEHNNSKGQNAFDMLNFAYSDAKIKEAIGVRAVSKAEYMVTLLDLEKNMYGRNTRVGIMKIVPHIGMGYLYEVIEFLGFSRDEAIKDEFVRTVYSSMRGLYENPYYGCEAELVSLIKVVVLYISEFGLGGERPALEDEKVAKYVAEVDRIFYEGVDKIEKAHKLEEQTDKVIAADEKVAAIISSDEKHTCNEKRITLTDKNTGN